MKHHSLTYCCSDLFQPLSHNIYMWYRSEYHFHLHPAMAYFQIHMTIHLPNQLSTQPDCHTSYHYQPNPPDAAAERSFHQSYLMDYSLNQSIFYRLRCWWSQLLHPHNSTVYLPLPYHFPVMSCFQLQQDVLSYLH